MIPARAARERMSGACLVLDARLFDTVFGDVDAEEDWLCPTLFVFSCTPPRPSHTFLVFTLAPCEHCVLLSYNCPMIGSTSRTCVFFVTDRDILMSLYTTFVAFPRLPLGEIVDGWADDVYCHPSC